MTPNPPIPGHALRYEGRNWLNGRGDFIGGCECGINPGRLLGVNAMKRWHRQHKAELREVES